MTVSIISGQLSMGSQNTKMAGAYSVVGKVVLGGFDKHIELPLL